MIRYPATGKSIDVTYQVIDNNGDPVNGTFIFAMVGINLERDPYRINSVNACKGLWWVHDNYPDMHFLNEQIAVTNSSIASDYIYVRANNTEVEPLNPGDTERSVPSEKRTGYYPQIVEVEEDGVKKTVEELFLQGALTEEEAASVDEKAILRTLRSDVIREARKYPIKREQPFMMYVPYDDESGKVLVQGVIDLLIDEGDGYVVVDFKTGGGSEEELRNRYGKQLSLYAEGVEKILKKPVKRKIIYAINSGKTVET